MLFNNCEQRVKIIFFLPITFEVYQFFEFSGIERGVIIPSSSFDQKSKNWIRNSNHNFLRISRILESLSILGLKEFSHQFLSALLALDKTNTDRLVLKASNFGKNRQGNYLCGFKIY